MNLLRDQFSKSPSFVRVAPFFIFLALTFCQGQFGEASRYWFYLGKTLAGAWLIWMAQPWIEELKWAVSREAVVAGVAVFLIWVGLDGLYPTMDQMTEKFLCPLLKQIGLENWCPEAGKAKTVWNPFAQFGGHSALAWVFIVTRILGSAMVVPPLEEVFYRSFLYRYIARPDFQSVPLGEFRWPSFLITAAIFGFAHYEWLAGILCAFAYQGLVCWKKRLGDALTAHAITNFLLGLWVVWKGAWNFW